MCWKREITVFMWVTLQKIWKKWGKSWDLEEDRIICQLTSKAAPYHLPKRLTGDGSYEMLPEREEQERTQRSTVNVSPATVPMKCCRKESRRGSLWDFLRRIWTCWKGMEPADRG